MREPHPLGPAHLAGLGAREDLLDLAGQLRALGVAVAAGAARQLVRRPLRVPALLLAEPALDEREGGPLHDRHPLELDPAEALPQGGDLFVELLGSLLSVHVRLL